MAFEFSQIIAELVQSVGFGRKLKRGEDSLVDLLCGPTADGGAGVKEHLQEPDDAGVVDLDAGIPHRTGGNRQGQPLEQGEVHMDVEALGLERSETVGDGLESLAHGVQMIQPFLQAEVAQIVGAKLVAQEAGELLILFEESMLPVSAEDMMAMLDLVDHGGELSAEALVQPDAEDFADAVGCQSPEADLTASLEDLVNGEMALKDEIAAVFDLGYGVEAREVHLPAFFLGKLRPHNQCPVIESLTDDGGAQAVGGGL